MKKTLGILKPDLYKRNLQKNALKDLENIFGPISQYKHMTFSKELAENFYQEHKEKPFFSKLVNIITSAPVVVFILEGDDIITKYRENIGATNPKEAKEGTLRKKYGISIDENSFHGSANETDAIREINLIFN